MKHKRGYTLIEMLSAIAVVGLAIAGLAQGSRVIATQQARSAAGLAQTVESRRLQAGLVEHLALVAAEGLFVGEPLYMTFDCAADRRCEARIVSGPKGSDIELTPGGLLHVADEDVRFEFVGSDGVVRAWRSRPFDPTPDGVRLIAGSEILAFAAVRSLEHPGCEFDLLVLACRSEPA